MATSDVLTHHLQAFAAGDVAEVLKDFGDDSVLLTPERVIKGREEIRAAFEDLFNGLFRPGTYQFEMVRMEVVDDVAFISWHSQNEGANVTLGSDTFVIRDGKIAVQTFVAKVEPV